MAKKWLATRKSYLLGTAIKVRTGLRTYSGDIPMNFNEMTFKELREYLLTHRDDVEALHAFSDRAQTMPPKAVVGANESLEKLNEVTRAIAKSAS